MSTTEDRARAAMRAIAATVNDAPPLQLKPAQDPERAPDAPGGTGSAGHEPHRPDAARPGKFRSGGRGPRRPGGAAGPSRSGRGRRWQSWLVPLTAAAVVVALAVSLVLVKDIHPGPPAPGNATAPATAPASVPPVTVDPQTIPRYTGGTESAPRYYLALKQVDATSGRYGIVVGDSLTGQTLATFAPPANTTFQSVSAAADDRTFVVVAVTSSTGGFGFVPGHATLTGSWYEVRLAPGTAHPATLTRLPIKPVSWVTPSHPELNPQPGQIFATALSESGQELAVSDIPDIPAAAVTPRDWQEVKVFSVATGQLLRDWIGYDPTSNLSTAVNVTFTGVPPGTPDLTWIDGDQALALATSYQASKTVAGASKTVTGIVRSLNVAGPANGNLITDSRVLWSGTLSGDGGCFGVDEWPPQISADGNTITCVTGYGSGPLKFDTEPLAAGTTASTKPTVAYQANARQVEANGWFETGFLWVSPSAGTLIVQWVFGGSDLSLPDSADSGVVSHGQYTPLRIPKSVTLSMVDITF